VARFLPCARRLRGHLGRPPWHHRPTKDQTLPEIGEASLEWGVPGALAALETATTFVVVDILSFSTAVTLAVARGTEVVPCPDDHAARRLAAEADGTVVAVSRSSVDTAHPWSLSPAGLSRAPAARRLVLASPNGAAVAAALAAAGKLVVACSLRNVTAVGGWLRKNRSRPDTTELPPGRGRRHRAGRTTSSS
jgi:2-phosphosulfolactate phosphatase